ncbi:MAG: transcription-repair coupling factor [Alphaproteobacteria bacterium]
MSLESLALDRPGRVAIGGMPEGYDALVMGRLAELAAPTPLLYVAPNDVRLANTRDCLAFFAPDVARLLIPAWDCLPYDRISPRNDLVSERISSLVTLAAGEHGPRVVLTTVNSLLQRVPPRAALARATFTLRQDAELNLDDLFAYLESNGFARGGTVMEAGDYAVRGGIIDIFPPGAAQPVRLDLFGETLEAIKTFDPVSQRSEGALNSLQLVPVSEVVLNEASIARFRSGYRSKFGAVTGADPLFEAVNAGRRYPGMEHWLPLFYENLETIFDYLPGAPIFFDHLSEDACGERWEAIEDYYRARTEGPGAMAEFSIEGYKPLPPKMLYITREERDACFANHAFAALSPFTAEAAPERQIFDAGGRQGRSFVAERSKQSGDLFDTVHAHLDNEVRAGRRVVLAGWSVGTRERIGRLLMEHGDDSLTPVNDWRAAEDLPAGAVSLAVLPMEHGFVSPALTIVAEQDILGDRLNRRQRRRRVKPAEFLADVSELSQGDLVVHADHGIGRYDGLVTLDVDNAPHDCLRLLYDGDDRLLLPVENIELLSRYGSADQPVSLDRLGGAAWQARKARLKKRVKKMAGELMKIAAQRALRTAPVLAAESGPFEEFCARFPYTETDDQDTAIEECLNDLASGRPMDRLICGDVGFGKTEIALRAAFHSALSGKQVAILAPTTLLCRQHLQIFRERFENLPVRVEQLSRLVKAGKAAEIRHGMKTGTVDIVIGTHALLGKTIEFADLGLLIVDEEQHFGVAHKERLKKLRTEVHVLTLSATPIPRTLQMALTGVRDMSIIATPPIDRLAVRTFIMPFDPVVTREALRREHFRGGQSFYVCPRIADLDGAAERVRKLVPEVKVGVAHGGMPVAELESVMADFYDGNFDVLVSTAIIESGLDLPRVNTMIVHRADMFGLSQLYQLRGRIGRAKLRGYAYFTLPPAHRVTATARKRLAVIHRLDSLGAGFSLASHDMDIRGAGNLLGGEQSGHIREVGIELYQHMLEEAVAQARAEAQGATELPLAQWSPHIGLGTAVLIPASYVEDLDVRLALYRRVARLEDGDEIEEFIDELADRFGPVPEEVRHLLDIVAIKRLCRVAGISRIDAGPKGAVLTFRADTAVNPERLIAHVADPSHGLRLRPDNKLVVTRNWPVAQQRLEGVRRILGDLNGMVE